jgi:DNA-directed RNA polymerase subunit M/transcription elongation factor TFIIS
MRFCSQCNNMYYIKLGDDDQKHLVYYCRNCGYEENEHVQQNICVLKTDIKSKRTQFSNVINEYTKEDPTLPRITTMRCPNSKCPSHSTPTPTTTTPVNESAGAGAGSATEYASSQSQSKNEIIYIRYDDKNMKYMYLCVKCDTKWKTD